MARFLFHDDFVARRRYSTVFLALLWTLGLSSGIWAFVCADTSFFSLMRSSLLGTVSIVGLLRVTLLPFLFSAFAVFISCPCLMYPIVFAKGCAFSFVSMGAIASFGNSGWLLWFLLCFSDVVSMPVLYWFWMWGFRSRDPNRGIRTTLVGSLLFLAGSIDYCVISPFLAELIIF